MREYSEAVHGEKKGKCLLCNPHKEIVFHGGTTNLHEHLASQHPFNYSTKQQDFSKCSCCSEAHSIEITELIVEMVVVDMRPLNVRDSFEPDEVS